MARPFERLLPAFLRSDRPVVPVIRLQGAIMAGSSQLRPTLSLATTASLIDRAFAYRKAPAVALLINSPGGSAVQSRLIFRRIRDLAEEKGKHVIAFVEDVAASGGYMLACAGDEIVADPSSIVGSIGVVTASFGFPELLKKAGIERRVHTAGRNKAVLDPFLPEKQEDIDRLKEIQADAHEMFIDLVRSRRDLHRLLGALCAALVPEGALWRQDRRPADFAIARSVRPPSFAARHGGGTCRKCRRWRAGHAGGTRAVESFRPLKCRKSG